MEQQKTKRTLKYEFTEVELLDLGRDLSLKSQELRNLEDQKKSVVSEFGSRMTIAKEQIGQLSDKVSAGYEMRDVLCMVDYHLPEGGKKTFTRTDTGEGWVEPMNETDHNLFTQWEERERERLENEDAEMDAAPQVEDDPDGLPDEDLEMEYDGEYAEDATPRAANGRFAQK
jgi:hypothetical protein